MSRIPLLVARTEFRRTVRAVSDERTKLLVMALLAVFMVGPITVVGAYLLPELGAQVAHTVTPDEAALATEIVTGGVAVGWLFLAFMAAIRAFTTTADPDEPAFLFVSTSLRNTVVGVVAAEILLFAVWIVPPAILLSAAFAHGAGTVLPPLFAALFVAVERARESGRDQLLNEDVEAAAAELPEPAVSLGRVFALTSNKQAVLRHLVDIPQLKRNSVTDTTEAISASMKDGLSPGTIKRFLYEMADIGVVERVQSTETEGKGRPPSRVEVRFSPTVFRRLYDLRNGDGGL